MKARKIHVQDMANLGGKAEGDVDALRDRSRWSGGQLLVWLEEPESMFKRGSSKSALVTVAVESSSILCCSVEGMLFT